MNIVNFYVRKFQLEWNEHNKNYSEDGFKEYCLDTMDSGRLLENPEQIDEVMRQLDLTR